MEANKQEGFLQGYNTVDDFVKEGFKIVVEATKHANALPAGGDWNFYNAYESFSRLMNNEGNEIMNSVNNILRKYEVDGNIKNRSIEEQTELIVEANDVILENVANNIDEMNGIKKTSLEPVVMQTVSAQLPINGSWNSINRATFSVTSSNSVLGEQRSSQKAIRLLTGKNIIRPQKLFKDKIDNSNNHPWEPRIKDKPNLLKPLAIFLEETENGEEFSHPYEFELEKFCPSPEQLKETIAVEPKPISETPLVEVTEEEHLKKLLEDLENYSEIAIDLEHHSYRSFMGITCLMQISTKDTDYLVDTLALRDKLHILNEVFTKPSVLKIFHGADMDIQWLQRDLSLYVVNMFDTHQAAKVLGYSGLSLSYLLNKFCNFSPNKHFQLADWRIRPLPDELKMYAREDTHYLIYIYHLLKNKLLQKGNGNDNFLRAVYQRSTEVCKKRYLKPILREDSYLDFYRKCKRLFNNRQLYALKELYRWRDHICREEDESTGYVLPNHMLLQISELLPREMQGILACCNPIPPLVRSNLLELHHIILRAREQPLEKPIMKEDPRERGSTKQVIKINIDSQLHCPHDLSKAEEFRDDLPTLLGGNLNSTNEDDLQEKNTYLKAFVKLEIENTKSALSVFDSPENSESEGELESHSKLKDLKFLGPYERYKLVKPFVQAEEQFAAEKEKHPEADSTTEPSIEDRIASLHAHFVEVSKAAPQQLPQEAANEQIGEPMSLVAMGGSNKRKHEYLEDDPQNYAVYGSPQDELCMPAPRGQNKNRYFGRGKRKRPANESYPVNAKIPKTNANQYQNIDPNQSNAAPPKKQRNRNRGQWRNKNKKGKNKGQNQNVQNVQQMNQPCNQNKQQQKNKKPDKQQRNRNNQQQQQNSSFTPYNYTAVDFRQFQGGAGEVSKPQAVKAAFKNRGRKRNRGGANNKSFSFGNNPGRGRGRGRNN